MQIFLPLYEALFQTVIKILPITHQNKTKIPGKKKVHG